MWLHRIMYNISVVKWISIVLIVAEARGLLQQAEGNAASSRNLLIAVTDSDLDAVRVLLDPRQTNPVANVDTANSVGSTPLMLAVAADASDIVTEILDAGAAVDLQNVDGLTALHFAAQEGHESTLMKLLAVNPDLELRTTGGATPLYIACQQGHLQVLRILLQAGAVVDAEYSTGATPLLAAAQNGNVPIIKELLSANANLFHVNNNQVSAVHFAASSRAGSNAVKLVVSSGLSVDAKDKWMDTPLDYAAYFGNGNVVATLLELGANITALDIRQGLPLDSLCECKRGSDLPGKLGCSDGQCSDEAITRLKRLLDPAAQDPDSQGVDSQAIGKESPDKPQNPPERLLETKPLKGDVMPKPAAQTTTTRPVRQSSLPGCSLNCRWALNQEAPYFPCLSEKGFLERRSCLQQLSALVNCVVGRLQVCKLPISIFNHFTRLYGTCEHFVLFEQDCVLNHMWQTGHTCSEEEATLCRKSIVERMGGVDGITYL